MRRERIGARGKLAGRAFEDDLPAVLAGTRTEVEHAIRGQHDLRVVLDDEQRVAVVAQPMHDLDHAPHVARMQTDRRLVEHEQRIDQRGAERRRQVDALDLAARERARLAVERQVAEADAHEEVEPRAHLAEQHVGRFVERRRQARAPRRNPGIDRCGSSSHVVDVEAWLATDAVAPRRQNSASALSRAPLHSGHGV